jgi:hypothetical protein
VIIICFKLWGKILVAAKLKMFVRHKQLWYWKYKSSGIWHCCCLSISGGCDGTMITRNCFFFYIVLHRRRLQSKARPLWEPQISVELWWLTAEYRLILIGNRKAGSTVR